MRVLGDVAKIAITWAFGTFWSCFLRQIVVRSLRYKWIQFTGKWRLCQRAIGLLNRGLLFGRFLKNFSRSPLCTFSENAGFGWPCKNCNNLAIRALFGAAFCAKIFSNLCILSAYWLDDNAVCATVLLSLSNEGYFLGDFWKISLGVPFARF